MQHLMVNLTTRPLASRRHRWLGLTISAAALMLGLWPASCKHPLQTNTDQPQAELRSVYDQTYMLTFTQPDRTEYFRFEVCLLVPDTLVPKPLSCINAFRYQNQQPVLFKTRRLESLDPSREFPALSGAQQAQMERSLQELQTLMSQNIQQDIEVHAQQRSDLDFVTPETAMGGMAILGFLSYLKDIALLSLKNKKWTVPVDMVKNSTLIIVSAGVIAEVFRLHLYDPDRIAAEEAQIRTKHQDLLAPARASVYQQFGRIPLVIKHYPKLFEDTAAEATANVTSLTNELGVFLHHIYSDAGAQPIAYFCLPHPDLATADLSSQPDQGQCSPIQNKGAS